MQLTLGLLLIIILIVFPGLLFRRLYYYGEFSKQFSSNHNLVGLLAISSIPGIFNFILIFFFYDIVISPIDFGGLIDKFKEINDPNFRYRETNSIPLRSLFYSKALPFILFLYMVSTLFGIMFGRLVRITKLDTKFKLLRFQNYWFYFFSGENSAFSKMKFLHKKSQKHLFSKADILIDTNTGTLLYSGIIVDYELKNDNCSALDKIMLKETNRYSKENKVVNSKEIPGDIFIVDCNNLKNINLTYIHEDKVGFLEKKWPNLISIFNNVIVFLIFPLFNFQAEAIKWNLYQNLFYKSWLERMVSYLFVVMVIYLFNPIVKDKGEYSYIDWKTFFSKILWLLLILVVLFILSIITK